MRTTCLIAAAAITLAVPLGGGPRWQARAADDAAPARTGEGLLALYDFASASGPVVKDRAGIGEPLDLKISDERAVKRSEGSLKVRGKTLIRSDKPASRIIDAVRRTGEITVEAWIRPANRAQEGPARIATLSKNTSERNFTLGQEKDRFDVRLRTTKTSTNGLPSLNSAGGSVATRPTHVVYTRDRRGRARLYVDGKESGQKTVAGAASNWDGSFRLALANELTGDRPWLGTYYMVAIYGRSLSPAEVERYFKSGPAAKTLAGTGLAGDPTAPGRRLFEGKVAPLLADRCLDCHDSATRKGRLDLSRKDRVLAGGESGPAIVPKKPGESPLWDFVDSDEMPKGGPPLSPEEKKLLREWIAAGAVWSLPVLDPANYLHGERAGSHWVRRLTVPEYVETVRSAVGVDVADEARAILPPDLRADGFKNTAYNLGVDLKHVEAYARLAEIIVGRMDVVAFAGRFQKGRSVEDDQMRGLISKMGKWVLRGPLEEHEVVALRGIATTVASAGGDFEEAVRRILEAMLQSPRFIYRIEDQRGGGVTVPVGDYELASRLSYILWGGPPDEELMRAAEAGELSDPGRVAAQVRRMLEDPRAVERSLQFADQWLDLDRLDYLKPSPKLFPDWDEVLAADMRAETRAFFRHLVWTERRPLADLFNAQVTFATPRLAAHYGLEPAGASADGDKTDGEKTDGTAAKTETGEELARYDLSQIPSRGGLLTQASVLTVGGDEASMVSRGLFVLHDLLRGAVKDPPPCVDTTPVPTREGLTRRGIAEDRIANKACGGCHAKFEPLAFGLERFDGIGAYHDRDEHGNPLREDGELLFPLADGPVPYDTSAKLMDLLAESDRVQHSLTWKVTQFALGRPLGAADAPIVDTIHKTARKEGGTYAALITAVVMSDLVQLTRTETDR